MFRRNVLWSEINTDLTWDNMGEKRNLSPLHYFADAACRVGSMLCDRDAKVFPPLLHIALSLRRFIFPVCLTSIIKVWMNQ